MRKDKKMILFVCIIFLLALSQIELNLNDFYDDYASAKSAAPIKGIFVLLIFASHFSQYVVLEGSWNDAYLSFRSFCGQLVVVPFLFYSGYGVAASIRARGETYYQAIPVHRVGQTLFQFDMAILLFFVLRCILYPIQEPFSFWDWIMRLIGWESIGNSNWYVFVILGLYLITWVSFSVFGMQKKLAALFGIALLTIYFAFFLGIYKEDYWYNTILTYVLGIFFAFGKESIDYYLFGKNRIWIFVEGSLLCGFLLFHRIWWDHTVYYQLASGLFALFLAFTLLKVKVTSRVLTYCGEHIFSLFILQRLPMMALEERIVRGDRYLPLYFILCLVITFLISAIFDSVVPVLWKQIEHIIMKNSERVQ